MIATPRRYRNREHLRYVAARRVSSAAANNPIRIISATCSRALGRKASDEFAVPLCRSHHRAVHRAGDEQAWWTAAGIDPVKVARQLWRQTRLNDPHDPHQPISRRAGDSTDPSASDGEELRSDQVGMGRADDGRTP